MTALAAIIEELRRAIASEDTPEAPAAVSGAFCRVCEDNGTVPVYSTTEPERRTGYMVCSCVGLVQFKMRLAVAEIPARYARAEGVGLDLAPIRAGRGYLLAGPPGCGKSTLAAETLTNWIRSGGTGRWISCKSWLGALRPGEGGVSERTAHEWIRSAGLLVIDDLGTTRQTEWAAEQLGALIELRYDEALPLIVTTNRLDAVEDLWQCRALDPADAASETAVRKLLAEHGALTGWMDARLRSRLYEMTEYRLMLGPDRRRQ